MKKLLVLLIILLVSGVTFGQNRDQRIRQNSSNVNSRERSIINKGLDQTYENEDTVLAHNTRLIVLEDSIAAQAVDFTTGELNVNGDLYVDGIFTEDNYGTYDLGDYTDVDLGANIVKARRGTLDLTLDGVYNYFSQYVDTVNFMTADGLLYLGDTHKKVVNSDVDQSLISALIFQKMVEHNNLDASSATLVGHNYFHNIKTENENDSVFIDDFVNLRISGQLTTGGTDSYIDVANHTLFRLYGSYDNDVTVDLLSGVEIWLKDIDVTTDSIKEVRAIYNKDDGIVGADATYFLYSEYGDNYLNGDLEVTGNISTDTLSCNVFDNFIPHMFLYFGDSAVSKSYTTSWAHLTNAPDSIFIQDELEGFTVSNDTIVSTYSGDFDFDANFTHDADNGETVSIRFFNVTTGSGIPVAGAQKGGGSGDYGSTSIIAYSEIAAGDKIVVQYKGDNNGTAVFKNGVVRIKRIH